MQTAQSKTLVTDFLQNLFAVLSIVEVLQGKSDSSSNEALGCSGGVRVMRGGRLRIVWFFYFRGTDLGLHRLPVGPLLRTVPGQMSRLVASEAQTFLEVPVSFFGSHPIDIHRIGIPILGLVRRALCPVGRILVSPLGVVGLPHTPLVLELCSLGVEAIDRGGHGFEGEDLLSQRTIKSAVEEVGDDIEVRDLATVDDVPKLGDVLIHRSFPLGEGSESNSGGRLLVNIGEREVDLLLEILPLSEVVTLIGSLGDEVRCPWSCGSTLHEHESEDDLLLVVVEGGRVKGEVEGAFLQPLLGFGSLARELGGHLDLGFGGVRHRVRLWCGWGRGSRRRVNREGLDLDSKGSCRFWGRGSVHR